MALQHYKMAVGVANSVERAMSPLDLTGSSSQVYEDLPDLLQTNQKLTIITKCLTKLDAQRSNREKRRKANCV